MCVEDSLVSTAVPDSINPFIPGDSDRMYYLVMDQVQGTIAMVLYPEEV